MMVIRIHYKSAIDHNIQWVWGSMFYKLFMCCCAALLCLSSMAAPKDDISDLAEFSSQLDAQDKQQFSTLLGQIDTCTRSREYACSERLLAQARKYAQGRTDTAKLEAARNRLARERDVEAREIQAQKDEEERIAKAEKRKERQREKWEQQQRDAEAAQSHSAMYQSIGAAIAAAGQDVSNYVNSSGQALLNAQRMAQNQQLENDRKRHAIDDAADRERDAARDARKRIVESSRSNAASSAPDSTTSANRDPVAAESKRKRDEALLAQKKQDQELAALQQNSYAQAASQQTTASITTANETRPASSAMCVYTRAHQKLVKAMPGSEGDDAEKACNAIRANIQLTLGFPLSPTQPCLSIKLHENVKFGACNCSEKNSFYGKTLACSLEWESDVAVRPKSDNSPSTGVAK